MGSPIWDMWYGIAWLTWDEGREKGRRETDRKKKDENVVMLLVKMY